MGFSLAVLARACVSRKEGSLVVGCCVRRTHSRKSLTTGDPLNPGPILRAVWQSSWKET